MIKYQALHHVSLTVSNIEQSKHFYSNILGLIEEKRPQFDFPGAWYKVGNQQVHLIEDPHLVQPGKTENITTRESHFALRVHDYHEALAWLKQHQVPVIEKPDSKSGFAQIYLSDPDGHVIELNVDQQELRTDK